jgi:DNA-binding CsgD family transcriptional regulator
MPSTISMACSCAHLRLDDGFRVVGLDGQAQAILPPIRIVLRIEGSRLVAPQAQADLDRCLSQASAGRPAAMLLKRNALLPLTLLFSPLSRSPFHGPGVLVHLRDPLAEQPDESWLQHLFGLTPAEAGITAALAMGRHCVEIAQDRGVQPNTVRAHLKRAMAKTGTPHQVALVSLILRCAPTTGAAPGGHPPG